MFLAYLLVQVSVWIALGLLIMFNSFIACSRFLDPTDKITAGESVYVTLAHTEQVSSLENQDSEP